ncbi:MAG TPA: type III pantothenate kinase [Candidatus Hydrogenedentes bacterium]|nr:type III pantothenate kinase [Candidatus Hydrogenedentota bacterium]
MLAVMDVGNSNTVIGLYEGEDLRGHWRIVSEAHRTEDELRIFLHMFLHQEGLAAHDVTGCCISSVVPPLNRDVLAAARAAFGVEPIMVGPGLKTGLTIQVENPKEVGADRIVNAVAAVDAFPDVPLIVLDFGTATTFDAITANAEYRGGVIVPGIAISADALFEKCAKLPRVEISRPPNVIGRDTVTHIRSGLTYGYADLVDGLITRMAEEMGTPPTVVATGGLVEAVAGIARRIDHIDPYLTLKGLKALYRRNAKA